MVVARHLSYLNIHNIMLSFCILQITERLLSADVPENVLPSNGLIRVEF